jgi:hypothetical protein
VGLAALIAACSSSSAVPAADGGADAASDGAMDAAWGARICEGPAPPPGERSTRAVTFEVRNDAGALRFVTVRARDRSRVEIERAGITVTTEPPFVCPCECPGPRADGRAYLAMPPGSTATFSWDTTELVEGRTCREVCFGGALSATPFKEYTQRLVAPGEYATTFYVATALPAQCGGPAVDAGAGDAAVGDAGDAGGGAATVVIPCEGSVNTSALAVSFRVSATGDTLVPVSLR